MWWIVVGAWALFAALVTQVGVFACMLAVSAWRGRKRPSARLRTVAVRQLRRRMEQARRQRSAQRRRARV
jgi:Flp pilus assembly protein TadB